MHKSCIILGNGPSLKSFLNLNITWENFDLLCVNYFPKTAEFEMLKPRYYVITSPNYYIPDYYAMDNGNLIKDRLDTIKALNDRTTWPLFFFIPYEAKGYPDWQKLVTNKQISIIYFNNTPVEGFQSVNFLLYKKKLGLPRPHNVMIPSIYLAILLNYEKVYLTGTDHSWLKEIFVTPDNDVLLSQKHYYDQQVMNDSSDLNKPTPKPMHKGYKSEHRKLHEVLDKFQLSFAAYWELNAFAGKQNVNITNLVPDSYIDAFVKIRAEEISQL